MNSPRFLNGGTSVPLAVSVWCSRHLWPTVFNRLEGRAFTTTSTTPGGRRVWLLVPADAFSLVADLVTREEGDS